MTRLELIYDISRKADDDAKEETTTAESVKATVARLLASTQTLVRTVENMPSPGPVERPLLQLQA